MNLLIPYGRISDKYLTRAAQELGHHVHFMCNRQKINDLGEARRTCLPDTWVPMFTRYDLKMNHEEYLLWYREKLSRYVRDNKIDAILPCSSSDLIMNEIASVNEEYDLLGIRPEQAAIFGDKSVYLPAMAAAGIPVPEIYEIVEPNDEPKNYEIQYPCIAKPGLGCGGWGIYVARDEDNLRRFFGPSENPEDFNKCSLHYQDRDFTGRPKYYLHFGMGGRYLVQEFLDGPSISLAGAIVNGVLELDMAYEFGITPPPTCSEVNWKWSGSFNRTTLAAEELVSRINSHYKNTASPTFPDGAFMADAILYEGTLHLVDFSPRMSSAGTKMLYHACGDISYAREVIHATLGEQEKMVGTKPTRSVYQSVIPFPKGKITNIKYPETHSMGDSKIEELVTPIHDGDWVFQMRNDLQTADRGWVVGISETKSGNGAQKLVESFIDDIQYDVEE